MMGDRSGAALSCGRSVAVYYVLRHGGGVCMLLVTRWGATAHGIGGLAGLHVKRPVVELYRARECVSLRVRFYFQVPSST